MKKILISILAAALLMLCLSGCDVSELAEEQAPVQISSAEINGDGDLIITYSDGSTTNLGHVVGADGVPGADGKDGDKGEKGDRGDDGEDGDDGRDGADGKDGKDGVDGNDGVITFEGAESALTLAVSRALRSSVLIHCGFEYTTNGSTTTGGSAGSGVIYQLDRASGDAYIITNYHVVFDADSNGESKISNNISVLLFGGLDGNRIISAKYIGGSMNYDIAVLKVSGSSVIKESEVCAVTVEDSDSVRAGDRAFAVGNAENRGIAVTAGIISVDSEYLEIDAADGTTKLNMRVMRTDAAVNHGNSGGGFFNSDGELIGIVNAKLVATDIEGIGYAIPSNVATAVADNIIDGFDGQTATPFRRALLGIGIISDSSYAEFDADTGLISIIETVRIDSVTAGGIADGRLQAGDILLSAKLGDSEEIALTRQHYLIDLMLTARVGDTLTLKVSGSGGERTVEIEITAGCITDY